MGQWGVSGKPYELLTNPGCLHKSIVSGDLVLANSACDPVHRCRAATASGDGSSITGLLDEYFNRLIHRLSVSSAGDQRWSIEQQIASATSLETVLIQFPQHRCDPAHRTRAGSVGNDLYSSLHSRLLVLLVASDRAQSAVAVGIS